MTEEQIALGVRAWGALRAPDPREVERVSDGALPFLGAALRRHLEELPIPPRARALAHRSCRAQAVQQGAGTPVEAFAAFQGLEAAPWQGDVQFFAVLDDLARGPEALLRAGEDGGLGVLPAGARVLAGEADAVALRGGLDRWVGGVHLEGPEPEWRWDGQAGRVAQR